MVTHAGWAAAATAAAMVGMKSVPSAPRPCPWRHRSPGQSRRGSSSSWPDRAPARRADAQC
eukprot:2518007-Pleurochrysis_carterae.AAC.1